MGLLATFEAAKRGELRAPSGRQRFPSHYVNVRVNRECVCGVMLFAKAGRGLVTAETTSANDSQEISRSEAAALIRSVRRDVRGLMRQPHYGIGRNGERSGAQAECDRANVADTVATAYLARLASTAIGQRKLPAGFRLLHESGYIVRTLRDRSGAVHIDRDGQVRHLRRDRAAQFLVGYHQGRVAEWRKREAARLAYAAELAAGKDSPAVRFSIESPLAGKMGSFAVDTPQNAPESQAGGDGVSVAETSSEAAGEHGKAAVAIDGSRNRIDLSFPGKPSAAVRDRMKSAGWRWHSRRAVWFHRDTPENRRFAEGLVTP